MRPELFKTLRPILIPNIIFQHLAPILLLLLQFIFYSSLELCYYARLFPNLVTIFMQKLYKDNYIKIKLYRPITLFDIIENILELIFAKKISVLVKIYYILPKTYFKKKKNVLTKHIV